MLRWRLGHGNMLDGPSDQGVKRRRSFCQITVESSSSYMTEMVAIAGDVTNGYMGNRGAVIRKLGKPESAARIANWMALRAGCR